MPQPLVQNPALIQGFENAPRDVRNAVANASARTGVDFSYLMHKASAESSYNTNASAGTSSAKGLYQFIDQTWLAMVDRHGAKHGLGPYADAIEQGSDGRYRITDAAVQGEIMDLRFDPQAAANMAAEFAAENQNYLEGKLGRDVGSTDLYLAHFLGAGGAGKFLKQMGIDPSTEAASVMPKAAAANHNVFYDRATGKARSLAEVYDFFAAKFDESTGTTQVATAPAPAQSTAGKSYSGGSGGGISGFNWTPSTPRHTAGLGSMAGDDAIMRQLIQALSNDQGGFRSVATALGAETTIGRGLFANDLLLLAQQAL